MQNKKYRCTLPFSHLNITSRGVVTPCCNYDWRKNPIWEDCDNDYTKFTWIQEGLDNILHSAPWQDLRKKSNVNEPDPGCSNCYFSEEHGGSSRRTWALETFPEADNETKIISLELKLGAKCNLECRTCGPTSSNKLLREGSYEKFGFVDKNWVRRLQSFSDWTKDENFWNDLKSVSSDLQYIQFTGGEPLLIQEQYQYLQWLADNDIDPMLQYITNATIPLDDMKTKLWDNFSKLIIDFSIDGTGEVGEYVRTGSVWEEQFKNIIDYSNYIKHRNERYGGGNNINLATTVSILNVTEIRPVLDFMYDNGLENSSWSINIVRHENWLDIANLTGTAKEHAIKVVQDIIDDTKYDRMHTEKLGVVISRLNDSPTSNEPFTIKLKKKEQIHNILNSNRRHDYSKLLPDWWNMLVHNT